MIFNGLEKLSLVDYDGKVAATVFTGNCNFRCGFCHNGPLVTEADSLIEIPESEILDYLIKRKGILEGLCISGGEPTLKKDLPSFCEKVKKLGYSVKLDTNGTNPDMVKALFENGLCDYFAMDIKNDKAGYSDIIGIKNYDLSKVERTVDYFIGGDCDYEFRTTLISEFHKKNNIENMALWLKGAKKFFFQKYKDSDNCIEHGFTEVPQKTAEEYLSIMKNTVKHAALRGYDID